MREMRCTAVGKGRRRVGRRWNFVMSHSEMGLEGQAHVQSRTRGFHCPGMVVCAAVCGRARSFTSGTLSRQRLSQLISSCFMNHIAPNRHRFWPGLALNRMRDGLHRDRKLICSFALSCQRVLFRSRCSDCASGTRLGSSHVGLAHVGCFSGGLRKQACTRPADACHAHQLCLMHGITPRIPAMHTWERVGGGGVLQ